MDALHGKGHPTATALAYPLLKWSTPMGNLSGRASRLGQTSTLPTETPAALATWALAHTRPAEEVVKLQSWVTNHASAHELGALLLVAPQLLSSVLDHAVALGHLTSKQLDVLSLHLAAERHFQVTASLLLTDVRDEIPQSLSVGWPLKGTWCPLTTAGAIAGFFACQVALAASTERAIARLELPRSLLDLKQKHSAHCARALMGWAQVSDTNVRAFPETHQIASGINHMIDRYCALFETSNFRSQAPNLRRCGFEALTASGML